MTIEYSCLKYFTENENALYFMHKADTVNFKFHLN